VAIAEQTWQAYQAAGLAEVDPAVAAVVDRELQAVGSVLTNKYAEGYPGRRYYGGCEWVDEIEQLAIDRAKQLFGADHANVQPHAGGPANQAAYFALLEHGDAILGLRLDHGGHLTHGLKVNFSGRNYDVHAYGVRRDDSRIDFDELRRLARHVRPKLIVAGASAYPRVIDAAQFREIADEVGALLMVDMAHFAGLVAAGLHPNPVAHADVVTSTTHKTLAGPRSGFVLCRREHAAAVDRAVFPGLQGGPLCHAVAAKAVCFKLAASEPFKAYQRQIVANAAALAATLMDGGIKLLTDGTDVHLLQMDLRGTQWSGKDAEERLHEVAITVNRNTVPFDERPPTIASGVRIGTPAATMRGFTEDDMREVGAIILEALDPAADLPALRRRTGELLAGRPLYAHLGHGYAELPRA
jgi:glycine hydroxymethyltransferase